MKKLLLVILVTISCASNAQDILYGFKLGNNFSNLTGDDSKGFSSKSGLYVGALYKVKWDSQFALETGLSYSNLGASAVIDTSSITIGYLDYPLIFKYDVYYGINIQAGIELSLKIHSKIGNTSNYFEDNIRFGDVRYLVGAGYEFQNGICFDIIYKAGFSTIMEKPEEDYSNGNTITFPQQDIKNSAVLISVGYFFQ